MEEDDPRYTALLASWCQAAGCVRLGHARERGHPICRDEEWIVFFCTRGKQKHNRSGFYWGAPTRLSDGYDWATKFLRDWQEVMENRKDLKGKIGIAFSDKQANYWTPATVTAVTREAIAESVESTEGLTSYGWRRMAPSAGLKAKLTAPE